METGQQLGGFGVKLCRGRAAGAVRGAAEGSRWGGREGGGPARGGAGGDRRPGTSLRSRQSFAPRSRRAPTLPPPSPGGCLTAVPPPRLPEPAAMAPARRRGASRGRLPPAGREAAAAAAGGARSPRSAGVLLRRAVTAPAPLPACSPCLPPPASRRGRCRGRARGAAALSLPEPAAASPEKPHVLRAPRSPAARCAVRAADASHLPTGKRRAGGGGRVRVWRGSPLRPQTSTRPQPLSLPGSGGAGPGPFLLVAAAAAGGRGGGRGDAPLPSAARGRVGAGTGRWVFRCQKWTFRFPSGAGWRAGGRRAPCSCYTPSFVCARVRNTSRAAIACPAGREPCPALPCPAERLPPGFAPLAAPSPASFPFAFIFTEVGFSFTFV